MITVVLSDLHAGPGLGSWEWCSQEDVARQAAFLDALPPAIERVILAGDIFDNQVCPVDIRPPTTRETLALGPAARLTAKLRAVPERIEVFYTGGNHDATMDVELLHDVLPRVMYMGTHALLDDARIEHGHTHALFCAPDPAIPDAVPLGYFISRLAATADARTGGHTPSRMQVVDELLKLGEARETLPTALLNAMTSRAGVGDRDPILMPADLWSGRTTTIAEVRELYRDLVGRWIVANGALSIFPAVEAECRNLGPAAKKLLTNGTRAVIMGHTHRIAYEPDDAGVYANSGSWCDGATGRVEIDAGGVTVYA